MSLRQPARQTPTQTPASPVSDIDSQALDWFARRERALTPEEALELERWLAADPAHGAALERWQRDWSALDALPATGIERLRRQLAQDKAATAQPHSRQRRLWLKALVPRAALATAATLAVTGSGGYLAWQQWQQPVYTASFATRRGQRQSVTLPDGSVLQLDTQTRLAVTLYRQRREVRVLNGQAMFQVQGDPSRPFDVLAGAMRITVVGTRFSVRHLADTNAGAAGADEVRVEVEEGRVRVARIEAAAGGPAVLLVAGQAIAASAGGRMGQVASVSPAGVAPWREGRISFDDTPLSAVLAEFERYGDTGLVIRDPAVARLAMTGIFDPARLDNFLRLLPRALPVRLHSEGGVTEIVAR